MDFRVSLPQPDSRQRGTVYLWSTGWDDWFKFSTLFNILYLDDDGELHHIGHTKIGQFGLRPAGDGEGRPGYRSPDLPERFQALDERFFSLGQDTSYYENLSDVGALFRDEYLRAMGDIAYDPELRARAESEPVTAVSLLRTVPLRTVQEQLARLAHGGVRLTPYDFAFTRANVRLNFAVDPESQPPTNVHVLIGRNGVGKSTMLNNIAREIVSTSREVDTEAAGGGAEQLSNVVSVSFSAFDAFEPISVPQDRTKGPTYHYVGLKKVGAKATDETGGSGNKDSAAISREMTLAAKTCLLGARRPRLCRALKLLEGDPIFAAAGLGDLVQEGETERVLEELPLIFKRLSSGHKIVLLTVTKLVATVEEKSLVLLDEPEAHLHPPLLSAFVRSLSDLLTNRNGMAIVATHSPVVLQEVPRSCVWKLHRLGDEIRAERPMIETFGENVGTLTDEVFGLEVTATGFHKMLGDVAADHADYETALDALGGQLGGEGRAILRAMLFSRSEAHHVEG